MCISRPVFGLAVVASHHQHHARLVAFGDHVLGRGGRMVAAIEAIGRGEMAYENTPFALAVEG